MRYFPRQASTEPVRRTTEGDFRAVLRRKTSIPAPGRRATPVQRERKPRTDASSKTALNAKMQPAHHRLLSWQAGVTAKCENWWPGGASLSP